MLSQRGLNLFAALPTKSLPEAFNKPVRQANIEPEDYPSLILIGHAGTLIWQKLKDNWGSGPDPVDEYSVHHALKFVDQNLDGCRRALLYPGTTPIPLQQLGSMAGWHHDSPLGLGLHSVYGPWFGYRAALLVAANLPQRVAPGTASPCRQCVDKPCVSACPPHALTAAASPDVSACVTYRLQDRSPCASSCLARLACPVGKEFSYGDEQLRYFYRRSLKSIRSYMASSKARRRVP